MDASSVGRVDEHIVPSAPPPEPREQEREAPAETVAPEPEENSGKRLDLYA